MNQLSLTPPWPETDNYLERIGQINNDLMIQREIAAREAIIPTWLDELAIGPEDLLKEPEGYLTVRFLHNAGQPLHKAAMQVLDYREMQEEYSRDHEGDETPILELDGYYTAGPKGDEQLLALPEVESALMKWATWILEWYKLEHPQPLTFTQAVMLMHLRKYLEQEDARAEWVEDSLRSLLSSDFFKQGQNQQQTN